MQLYDILLWKKKPAEIGEKYRSNTVLIIILFMYLLASEKDNCFRQRFFGIVLKGHS
jgi:hypothetical protein